MKLSERLQMSADMVTPGSRVADVGCDHAHTSIWLIEHGTAAYCIAMDLRKGPLEHAAKNIQMCRCESKIETRLSDGLEKLEPGEADCILITGMGGGLMARILTDGVSCVAAARELVLQPQSEPGTVRKFIYAHGYHIVDEQCCRDFGKFYISLHAVKGGSGEPPYTESEFAYGRILPDGKNPLMYEYLCDEHRKALLVRDQLEANATANAAERLPEFLNEIKLLEEAISKFKD